MTNSFPGQDGLTASNSEANVVSFFVKQALGRVGTVKLVKIMKVKGGAGALAQAGTVNVMCLTNQTDGQGNATPHGTTYGLSYHRHQGGPNAVIMDPAAGDIGLALICDRDISANKAKRGQANPGSKRRFDLADGIYLGGILNDVPKQYVQFTPDGVVVADMNGNFVKLEKDRISVLPKDGNLVFVGGDGRTGTYDWILTPSGPSTNSKTRIG